MVLFGTCSAIRSHRLAASFGISLRAFSKHFCCSWDQAASSLSNRVVGSSLMLTVRLGLLVAVSPVHDDELRFEWFAVVMLVFIWRSIWMQSLLLRPTNSAIFVQRFAVPAGNFTIAYNIQLTWHKQLF